MVNENFGPYLKEFRARFPINKDKSKNTFFVINGGYMAVDAHIYWSIIRHFKPKQIIEIGAGHSTVLAGQACLLNERDSKATKLTAVEPYPSGFFEAGLPGLTTLIKEKIQDVDPSVWKSLGAGDILFIDSSHVVASGNDVHFEYLEILPRLKPGVFVHIHDISLPKRYPDSYMDLQLYWNEQYLLQAFLTHNSKFEVIWPGNYLMQHKSAEMHALFPEIADMRKVYPQSEPSAFWIRSV